MNKIVLLQKTINYDKVYFYAIMLFAFTMPLSRALVSFFVIFLPIIWLIEGNFKEKFTLIKSNKVLVIFSFYIFIELLSLLWTSNYKGGLHALRLILYFITMYVIATSLNKSSIDKIISAFLSGMFISEIIAYGVFFKLWHFNFATPQNPSPFMMHIDYSVFLAFTSILLLYRLLSKKYPIKERILFAIFFFTVTGNLFLATGRTGQVALLVALTILSIMHYKFSIKSIIMALLLISTIYSMAYIASDSFKMRSNSTIYEIKEATHNNLSTSAGERLAFWITTYHIALEHPFGVGLGDYKDATKAEVQKPFYKEMLNTEKIAFMSDSHPHNQYLLILLQSGVVGLIVFFYFIYNFFRLKIEDKEIKELSVLFGTIYFVSCLAEPLFVKQFTLALFILFMGIFFSASIKTAKAKDAV